MSSTTSAIAPSSAPTMTPDTNVTAVADKDTLLATSSPALPSFKDLRAFEHDRQRVKKAMDLAKGELYNSARKSTWPLSSEKEKRLRAEEVDALDGSLVDAGYDLDGVALSRDPSQPSEVKLSDLVAFRKPRKGLGTSITLPWLPVVERSVDGEFELIPHVRSVIVLDDITSHDLLVDEPWEYIYGSDEEESVATTPTKGPSYANVLSSK
ncbi:hypothetical protein B0H10DRAFT_2049168 [Mycena sp. CBHHK59/15]|nr:hypothetical protein B0H10DRAFT_2049168 [Mycena sp. CBHHK59/15]